MQTSLSLTRALCCLATAATLGACSSQSTADVHRSPAAIAASNSGRLPTVDGRNAWYQPGRPTGGANGPEYAVRTGSIIPQNQNRRGYTTDSPDNSFVYDQNDIRIQSTNSVGDSLRTVPGVSVRGGQ